MANDFECSMTDNNEYNEQLVSFAHASLSQDDGEKGICEVFCRLGEEFGLTRAFLLQTNELPFTVTVTDLWEKVPCMTGRKLSFNYNEWAGFNPFLVDDQVIVINDIEDASHDRSDRDFFEAINAKALMACVVTKNYEFIGSTVFVYSDSSREWTDSEIRTVTQISRLIAPKLMTARMRSLENMLLTDARRAAEEAKEMKNRFISRMSHDVRNPLNAIMGMINILRHNLDDRLVIEQYLEKMDNSAEQLMGLVNDCLDISLIRDGEMNMNMEWFELDALIEELRKYLIPLIENKNQSLLINCRKGIELYGDREKLNRVLLNILSNAIKFTDEGGSVSLMVERGYGYKNQTMFSFRVRDNGIGMSSEFIKKVFDPFAKELYDTSEHLRGSGLGLAIAKSMTELMHGSIDVYSSQGEGTEVIIELPFEVRGDEELREEEISAGKTVVQQEGSFEEMYLGRRVLIAEDNSLMSEIIATILGYRGLETDCAANGEEALNMYRQREPFYYDLIFMDIQMPVMNGLDATKAIRNSGKADAKLIPIVALSADAFNDDINQSLGCGMNEHLTKPVSEADLIDAIGRLVI